MKTAREKSSFSQYAHETDIDGEPRTADANTDMGADEYYYSPADYDSE